MFLCGLELHFGKCEDVGVKTFFLKPFDQIWIHSLTLDMSLHLEHVQVIVLLEIRQTPSLSCDRNQ